MKTLEFDGRKIHAFLPEGGARLKVWTHMQADDAAALFEAAGGGIALFAADGYDWNADLSPWPAKACFKGGEDFAGRAPAQLEWLAGAIETAEQELADAVGVSRQTVNFIETGRYMPSIVVALKIARYFGKHADEIFLLEDDD